MADPRLNIKVTVNGAEAQRDLGSLAGQVDQFGNVTDAAGIRAAGGFGKARAGVESISTQLDRAQSAAIGFFGAQVGLAGAEKIAQLADSYNNLQARIKLAAGEGEDHLAVSQALFDVAQRTQVPLQAIGDLYSRTAGALRDAGLSTQQSIAFTETLAQSFRVSGTSAQESNAAIIQLAQGLSAGALRGDEFNSVAEQSPRLLQALSEGLGVSRGELRKMAEAGQLTAEVITTALQSQSAVIAAEYAQLPLTIGGSLTQLRNELQRYVGETGNTLGATDAVATTIKFLADNIERLDQLLLAAAAGGLAKMTLALQAKAVAALAAARNATAVAAQTAAAGAAASASAPAVMGLAASFSTLGGALSSALTLFAAFQAGQAVGGAIYDVIGESLGNLIDRFTGLKAEQDEATKGFVKGAGEQATAAASQAKAVDGVTAALRGATNGAVDLGAGAEKSQAALGKLGADELVGGIAKLEGQIRVANDELAVFEEQMNALSGEAFIAFEAANRDAFDKAVTKVKDLETAIATLREAQLKQLGVDSVAVLTGIDSKAKELLTTFASLSSAVGTDARLIQAAFEGLLKKLDTPRELEALKASLASVKNPAFDAAAAVGEIEKKLKDVALAADPAAQKIAEAFNAFGIKTKTQLADAAAQTKTFYETVVASGQAGATELAKAFGDYAKAQLDAAKAQGSASVQSAIFSLQAKAGTDAEKAALEALIPAYENKAKTAESSANRSVTAADKETAALKQTEDQVHRVTDAREADIEASSRAAEQRRKDNVNAVVGGNLVEGRQGFGLLSAEDQQLVLERAQRDNKEYQRQASEARRSASVSGPADAIAANFQRARDEDLNRLIQQLNSGSGAAAARDALRSGLGLGSAAPDRDTATANQQARLTPPVRVVRIDLPAVNGFSGGSISAVDGDSAATLEAFIRSLATARRGST